MINGYYSGILGIDCDAEKGCLSEGQWTALDHSCLEAHVNEVLAGITQLPKLIRLNPSAYKGLSRFVRMAYLYFFIDKKIFSISIIFVFLAGGDTVYSVPY